MKIFKMFIHIWFTPGYARLERINKKKNARRKRIEDAYKYLYEWNDIPVSQLWESVCDILKINKNKAACDLVWRMNMDLRAEDLEKIIPL